MARSERWLYRIDLTLTTLALLICAYCPLFGLLAIRVTSIWWVVLALLALAGVIVGVGIVFVMPKIRSPKPAREVAAVRDRTGDVAAYLLAYLLPFLAIPTPTGRDIVAYALFLLVLAVLLVRSDLMFVNPLFYLFNYRVVSIRLTGDDQDGIFITNEAISPGDDVEVVRLTSLLWVKRR